MHQNVVGANVSFQALRSRGPGFASRPCHYSIG